MQLLWESTLTPSFSLVLHILCRFAITTTVKCYSSKMVVEVAFNFHSTSKNDVENAFCGGGCAIIWHMCNEDDVL